MGPGFMYAPMDMYSLCLGPCDCTQSTCIEGLHTCTVIGDALVVLRLMSLSSPRLQSTRGRLSESAKVEQRLQCELITWQEVGDWCMHGVCVCVHMWISVVLFFVSVRACTPLLSMYAMWL